MLNIGNLLAQLLATCLLLGATGLAFYMANQTCYPQQGTFLAIGIVVLLATVCVAIQTGYNIKDFRRSRRS